VGIWLKMRDVKISTHVGLTTLVPHFTTGGYSAFSTYGEHFEFVPVSYDGLGFIEETHSN